MLGAAWEATKTVLATGFRLIAAEVNRYLIIPFLRVRNTMGGIATTMREAFLRMKLAVVGVFETILQQMQAMFQALPGPLAAFGRSLASGLQAPLTSVQDTMRDIRGEITTTNRTFEREEQEREAMIAQAEERAAQARREYDEAQAERRAAIAEAQRQEQRTRAPTGPGGEPIPTRGVGAPPRPPTAVEPPPPAQPIAPSGEEQERDVRRRSSRREGARQGEREREAREIAKEMAISGFSGQAKRDMTKAFRAAMPRAPGRGRVPPPQADPEGQRGGAY